MLPKLLICGVVRNGGLELQRSLQAIDRIMQSAEDAVCVIVTNDNVDNTDKILYEWSFLDKRKQILNLDGIINSYPNRVDRIAFARNAYLREIEGCQYEDFTLICIMDLDGPNSNISPAVIENVISSNLNEWDALFANSKPYYYDIYALRHPKWCPTDCWQEVRNRITFPMRRFKKKRAVQKYVYERQYDIPTEMPEIPVDSAFGGLGIYKRHVINNAWYGSRNKEGDVICEHVVFHRQLISLGAKLFISPRLVNVSPKGHLGKGSGRPFPIDI